MRNWGDAAPVHCASLLTAVGQVQTRQECVRAGPETEDAGFKPVCLRAYIMLCRRGKSEESGMSVSASCAVADRNVHINHGDRSDASFDQYTVDSHGTEGTHTTLRKMIIFNIKRARTHTQIHTQTRGSNYRAMLHIVAITEGNIDEQIPPPLDVISTFINHARQMHSRMLATAKVNFKGKLDTAREIVYIYIYRVARHYPILVIRKTFATRRRTKHITAVHG